MGVSSIAVAASAVAYTAAPAGGAIIEIQFTGFDFTYDSGTLSDAGGTAVDSAATDQLISVSFLADGVSQGMLSQSAGDDLFADVEISGFGVLTPGVFVGGGAGSFDLFLNDTPGTDLTLDLSNVSLLVTSNQVTVAGATADADAGTQLLPFGVRFEPEDDLVLSFSGNVSPGTLVQDSGTVTDFAATGTGQVRGPGVIPEPGFVLTASLLAGGLLMRRRRGGPVRVEGISGETRI